MIRLSSLLLAIVWLSSCNKATGIKAVISNSDSVAINFFKGDGTMDSVYQVVIVKDKKQLENLIGYIESTTTNNYKCGYDGSLHFFKNNMVVKDIDFRMNVAVCMSFSFSIEDKLYATKLSTAAKQFLTSLRK